MLCAALRCLCAERGGRSRRCLIRERPVIIEEENLRFSSFLTTTPPLLHSCCCPWAPTLTAGAVSAPEASSRRPLPWRISFHTSGRLVRNTLFFFIPVICASTRGVPQTIILACSAFSACGSRPCARAVSHWGNDLGEQLLSPLPHIFHPPPLFFVPLCVQIWRAHCSQRARTPTGGRLSARADSGAFLSSNA